MKRIVFKGIPVVVVAPLLIFLFLKYYGNTPTQNDVITATFKANAKQLPLYGFNGDNSRGPAWSNKAFRDSAAALKFAIIRYPGGSLGEFWDWKKGWFIDSTLKQSNNIQLPETYRKTKYNPTGLAELKLLVDETHCDVTFDLNMCTKDLDDQIEMLKSAQELGIPIKWVELGNEYNIKLSPGRKKFNSPEDYGRACSEWIARIKETFPGVKVAVIGGDKQYAPDVRNWNNKVLEQAKDADAIVAHLYPPAASVADNDGINFQSVYDGFTEVFEKQGFENVNKNIWVTEYNIQWAAGPAGDEKKIRQQYAFTWGQALSTILMTSMATSLPKECPQMILDHNIANWANFAAIEVGKDSLRRLPNGIGFAAWSNASYDKTSLRQINFEQSDKQLKDFELLGWKFIGNNQNKTLLVNFTSNAVRINISALRTDAVNYSLEYCDKNTEIKSLQDVHTDKKIVENGIVELPAYSIATL